jgi:hypothetical protein
MMHRARLAMATDQEQSDLLHGIIEADECYVGGKPRKGNKRDDDKPNTRGRGTKKVPVVGAVERFGSVVAKVADANDLSANGLLFASSSIRTLLSSSQTSTAAITGSLQKCVMPGSITASIMPMA